MQRVATELNDVLQARDDLVVHSIVLRSSWKWIHVNVLRFLSSLAIRLEREALEFRADGILFTSMMSALPLLVAGSGLKKRGVRLGAIAHGLDAIDPNPAYQAALRQLRAPIDVVMPVSRATGEELVARGWPPHKVQVVPNGIDLARFKGIAALRQEAHSAEIRGGPPLPEDAFLLVAVGRQVRRKGFAWFIEDVMPKLPARVHLWLVGDGPERRKIAAAIRRHGLENRVQCLGRISESELVEVYRHGQLFVMPNIVVPGDMEGFGIVMLEAGACGLPVLGADIEGIRDVVREGVNGWFAPSGDADAFSERILSLSNNPAELRAATQRSAAYVANKFSREKAAERYLQLLRMC